MRHARSRLLFPVLILGAACTGTDASPAASGAAKESIAARTPPDAAALASITSPDSSVITLTTSAGEIEILVRRAWSPRGADRLHYLASHRFFDGARFFRVVPGFVVQFGLSGTPPVDSAWSERPLADDPVKGSNKRGTIVFATSGPNTRTTQLFINLADNAQLDAMGFAPLGVVRKGMDVVDRLYMEYGEGAPMGNGPDQMRLKRDGNQYLGALFPKLDSIVRTVAAGAIAPK